MQNKLKNLILFLLLSTILTTFNGLTQYPLNDFQMRKTARLKLEYISLLEENKSIHEMLEWCDSVRVGHMNVIIQLDDILAISQAKVRNLMTQYDLAEGKYELANDQITIERKQKFLFMGATAVAITVVIVVIVKNSIQ